MYNFNKFLEDREELLLVIKSKNKNTSLFFTFFCILLTFFLLFPMWQAGRQGLILWIISLLFFIILFIKQLVNKNNYYLLTNNRLISLSMINKDSFKLQGYIYLRNIQDIQKQGNNIILLHNNKPYYLLNINNINKVYNKIYNKIY